MQGGWASESEWTRAVYLKSRLSASAALPHITHIVPRSHTFGVIIWNNAVHRSVLFSLSRRRAATDVLYLCYYNCHTTRAGLLLSLCRSVILRARSLTPYRHSLNDIYIAFKLTRADALKSIVYGRRPCTRAHLNNLHPSRTKHCSSLALLFDFNRDPTWK